MLQIVMPRAGDGDYAAYREGGGTNHRERRGHRERKERRERG
jgi:hypothetical protein